jgi:tetratricopeptide (TPR) repeat protein
VGGKRRRHTDLAIGAGLVLLVGVVFGRTLGFELVTYDDSLFISIPEVQAGLTADSLWWALTTIEESNWIPVTRISWIVDIELARVAARSLGTTPDAIEAAVHHGVNVALHAANACLLFALLVQATARRWRSAFVAALFAIHPLHVESVAWASERKDVLSTLFWFLAMLAHQRGARSPSWRARYAVIGAFGLGLAAKPMLVTLPVVLLLWDFWPLGRLDWKSLRARVAEKLPLFALSAAVGAISMSTQAGSGALGGIGSYPLEVRVATAALGYVAYLGQTIWPTGISFLYLHPRAALAAAIPAALALAGATAIAVRTARSRPYLAVGWFWYLIVLLPVSGLVQVGLQARANRYTYVSLVGVFLIVGWIVPDWIGSWRWMPTRWRRVALGGAGAAVVLAAAIAAWPVVGYWRDSETLFRRALRVDPQNWVAHNNLGLLWLGEGNMGEALKHLRASLDIAPNNEEARYHLAAALEQQGRLQSAITEYERLLVTNPDHPFAHNNLGSLLARLGRYDEAIVHFEAAVRFMPDHPQVRANLEEARRAAQQSRLEPAPR